MLKKDNILGFCFAWLVMAGCSSHTKAPGLTLEAVRSTAYAPSVDYTKALDEWKNYYQHCTNEALFADGFYLELQDKVNIGSINNQHAIDVNKDIVIFDTSNQYGNIFRLLSIQNAFNCYDSINLVANLSTSFYHEVVKALNASSEYAGLTSVIDSGKMRIRITTLYTVALIQDNLVHMLDSTKDPSLLHFKELLMTPGNVLLAQTVDIFGFIAEFPLRGKLSDQQQRQLTKEVFFNLNTPGDNASIILLANGHLRLQLNKRYTVLGKFLQLKSN